MLARQTVKAVAAVEPVEVVIVRTAQGRKARQRHLTLIQLYLVAMRVPPTDAIGYLFPCN